MNKPEFITSAYCASRQFCQFCRDPLSPWIGHMATRYSVPDICPFAITIETAVSRRRKGGAQPRISWKKFRSEADPQWQHEADLIEAAISRGMRPCEAASRRRALIDQYTAVTKTNNPGKKS